MPETIISQFQRAFNSPIEIYRQVATPTERDNIPSGVRWPGMLVYVVSDGVTYSLSGGGVDNGSWELLGGLQDAPSDGQTYGRKDGVWSIINIPTSSTFYLSSETLIEQNGVLTNEDFLISNIPSNTLSNTGDTLDFYICGQGNGTGASINVQFGFDSHYQFLFNVGNSSKRYISKIRITRRGLDSVIISINTFYDTTVPSSYINVYTGIDFSAPIQINMRINSDNAGNTFSIEQYQIVKIENS